MEQNQVTKFNSLHDATQWIVAQLPAQIVMAIPLGLGKPNPMVNALYDLIKQDSTRQLKIFTALSLAVPRASGELQSRFLEPFRKRQWGDRYPELHYLRDLNRGELPPNVQLHEFYLQAGKSLERPEAQRDYISVNYTHVPFAIADRGVNLIVQMIARSPRDPRMYSLSCNPDLTLDVVDLYRDSQKPLLVVGVVHPHLPYCSGDSEVPETFFSAIVDAPEMNHELFALPRQPIKASDYMIGLHASLLVEDGGTLQIGIGSLSDALVHCMILRHTRNDLYRQITDELIRARPYPRWQERFHQGPFREGLYGTSEMVMDGFMHLRRAGILKREVREVEGDLRRYLHGAFYLGSKEFYEWLRSLDREGDRGFSMTRVSKVNDLYDADELALRRQRVKARFFNSCMKATLLGGAASDTNENGQVVSGVGGQYNFVAMSHELPDSFSTLMLNSVRYDSRGASSNFVWGQGQLTIPRHLRDVVISEYGIAFLKNRSDQECIENSLLIADSRFQDDLRRTAVQNQKLSANWRAPAWAESNSPQSIKQFLAPWARQGVFPSFPFGSDFTPVEEVLATALASLKRASSSRSQVLSLLWTGWNTSSQPYREALERMGLNNAKSWKEKGLRALLLGALHQTANVRL